MISNTKKIGSIVLSFLLVLSMMFPGLSVFAAGINLEITNGSAVVTEKTEVQEYRSVQFGYSLSEAAPAGSYVVWESDLPLLAGVDDSGKVIGYDYSKAAVIQQWLDNDVRTMPVVGNATANAIEKALESSGLDLETANTDMIVAVVSGINPSLGESLRTILDNMNVKITATLYDAQGNKLASDTVEVVVTKSLVANVAPTGVHITNKKSVPTTVAVGTTVQLHGACTPIRLHQGIKWSVGRPIGDSESAKHAKISSDGLVTFTSPGTVTIRVNPESTAYAAFSDTIVFTVLDQADLPVEGFSISGDSEVDEGASIQLSLDNIVPAGAYTGDVVWSSADPSIAAVDQNGVVTGLDGGSGVTYSKTTAITANINGIERSFTVKVKRALIGSTISSVEISGDSAVGIGKSSTYTATVFPSRLNTNKDVVRKWGIIDAATGEKNYANGGEYDNGIAKINDNGVLTGVSNGTVEIFVDAEYSGTVVSNTFSVIIGNAITDFTITGTNSVEEGKTVQLSISSIAPEDYDPALLETVVWRSADPSIASVDENGVVTGLDGGAATVIRPNTKTTTVTATIAGLSRSFEITVSSTRLNTYTGGYIEGPDAIVVDFPHSFSSVHSPARVDTSRQYWGIAQDNGQAPWGSTNNSSFLASFDGNVENSYASIDSRSALVTGKQPGTTTIWTYMARNMTSHQNLSKQINIVEIVPKSITLTAPEKDEYLEGETELDLTGMEVKLTYDREELMKYYPDAESYTDEQLTVSVTDYKVSEINPNLLDNEQYIIVTVSRAGKDMRAIFPITVKSKQVDTIEIKNAPKYDYLEGETELDLTGLTVVANYLNAPSEEITDYTVVTSDFNAETLNTQQDITVIYTHAGRTASATFPVIIYGIPVVSVSTGDYTGGWTNGAVTLELDATHQIDGITYYYRTEASEEWTQLDSNTLTVDTDITETYYFKAVNGKGIESVQTIGYSVSIDNVTPAFELVPEITDITNQSYKVSVNVGEIGASGIASITLNGEDITGNDSFVVDKNGTYTVTVTSLGGLSSEQEIVIENIDKEAPAVLNVELTHKNTGGFSRFMNNITFGLFFKEEVEATITAEDYGVAGIEKIEYRYLDENGEPVSEWAVYDESNKPAQSPDFKGYIEAKATDKASNVSDSFYSVGYIIDGSAPTDVIVVASTESGLYVSDTWTAENVNIRLSSTAFSDIYKYYYRVSGGEWQELEGDTLAVTEHGIGNYEFKSVSYADLESNITPFTVKIDKSVPVIRVDFEGTFGRWTSGDVKFAFSLLNESISGVTYYYDNGDGWTEITTEDEIILTDNVNASYIFKAVNGAGVESNPSDSYKVMIDNVSPSIRFNRDVTQKTATPYDVSWDIVSGKSGIKAISVNGEDITGQNKITVSENGKYIFVITGNNGITTAATLAIDNFVELAFNIKFNASEDGFVGNGADKTQLLYNAPVTVNIEAASNVGEIDSVKYRIVDENSAESEWITVKGSSASVELKPTFKGYIEAVAVEKSANSASDIFTSDIYLIDNTAPEKLTVTATADGKVYNGEWTDKNITVNLASDAFSGIKSYYYSVDGGEFVKLEGNSFVAFQTGEHTYSFKAVSNTGLESEISTLITKTDKSAPELSVVSTGVIGKWTENDVSFVLNCKNALSGVTYYYDNGNGWTELDGNVLKISADTNANYKFKCVNGIGKESAVSESYSVMLEKSAPEISVNADYSGEWTNKDVKFTLSGKAYSGIAYFTVKTDNGEWIKLDTNAFTANENGEHTYSFKAISNSGKESETVYKSVKTEKTVPALKINSFGSIGAWTDSDVSFVLESADTLSGVTYYYDNGNGWTELDGNVLKITADANANYTFKCVNGAGVESKVSDRYKVMIDKSAPEISVDTEYDGEWSNKDVSFLLGGKAYSDIAYFMVKTDNSEWTKLDTNAFIADENGEHTYAFKAISNSGKESAIAYQQIKLDKAVPVLNVTVHGIAGEWTADDVTFVLSNENSVSGVTYYYDNGNGWIKMDSNTRTVNSNANTQYKFKCVNAAGTESKVSVFKVMIDKSVPEITVNTEYDGKWTNKDVVFILSGNAYSDIAYYMVMTDDGEWTMLDKHAFTASENGEHTYAFKAISNAGKETAVISKQVKIDNNTPVLEISVNGTVNEWTADEVEFVLSCNNALTDVTYYYDNGNGWTELDGNVLRISASENADYIFKCVNETGVESEASESYGVMIDKDSVSEFTVNVTASGEPVTGDEAVESDITIEFSANAFSGIEKYQYSVNGSEWIDLDSNALVVTEDGKYTYTFRAVSNSGIISDEITVSFEINKNPVKLGDVNLDGKVSIIDAKYVLQHIAGIRDLNEKQLKAANVNLDQKISIVDARLILRMIAG